jgi:pimeloyl-ACP methyl ester carboxylesterase
MTTTATGTQQFTHTVSTPGPADGMTFTGLRRMDGGAIGPDKPLVIALPGGTYTSTYFDVPGYSLLDHADHLGVPVIAIDRPGYRGSTPVRAGDSIILDNAEVLDHLVAELWAEHGAGAAGVVLIGHSIGGATVCALAARRPSWPLLGIAVSGCLLEVPGESRAAWEALPDVPVIELPSDMKDFVMFGPEGTYRVDMPDASHAADAPVPKAELLDITGPWIARVRETLARIDVPVLARQGEFDRLWITDADQVEQFGKAFAAAPSVDARLVLSAGHCIDFHRQGTAFQLEQLAFALRCCIAAD